jgi:hypothetical protein
MKKHLGNLKMLGIILKEHKLSIGDNMCNGLKKKLFENDSLWSMEMPSMYWDVLGLLWRPTMYFITSFWMRDEHHNLDCGNNGLPSCPCSWPTSTSMVTSCRVHPIVLYGQTHGDAGLNWKS